MSTSKLRELGTFFTSTNVFALQQKLYLKSPHIIPTRSRGQERPCDPIENLNFVELYRMRFINSFISRTATFICFIGSICAFSSAQTTAASTRNAPIYHLYRAHVSTGEVIYDTLHGVTLQSASTLAPQLLTGQILIGAAAGTGNAANKLVYFDRSKKTLGVSFYGGP